MARIAMVMVWLVASASAALAQQSFLQIFNGRVGNTESFQVREGDLVIARPANGSVASATLNGLGQYSNLTVTRSANDGVNITFEVQRGSTRYALVPVAGQTEPITVPFQGFNNPLSAAFNARTVNGVVGPRIGSGSEPPPGGGGEEPEGDPVDVDGDGMITLTDAEIVMRAIVGDRSGVEDPERLDVNRDLRIDTDDVVEILRRVGTEAIVPEGSGDGEA